MVVVFIIFEGFATFIMDLGDFDEFFFGGFGGFVGFVDFAGFGGFRGFDDFDGFDGFDGFGGFGGAPLTEFLEDGDFGLFNVVCEEFWDIDSCAGGGESMFGNEGELFVSFFIILSSWELWWGWGGSGRSFLYGIGDEWDDKL